MRQRDCPCRIMWLGNSIQAQLRARESSIAPARQLFQTDSADAFQMRDLNVTFHLVINKDFLLTTI